MNRRRTNSCRGAAASLTVGRGAQASFADAEGFVARHGPTEVLRLASIPG